MLSNLLIKVRDSLSSKLKSCISISYEYIISSPINLANIKIFLNHFSKNTDGQCKKNIKTFPIHHFLFLSHLSSTSLACGMIAYFVFLFYLQMQITKILLVLIMANLIIFGAAQTPLAKNELVRLCGRRLANMMSLRCGGRFNHFLQGL